MSHKFAATGTLALILAISLVPSALSEDKPPRWSFLTVPGVWEKQGDGRYKQHDGFAWYRCYVKVPESWTGDTPTLWNESVTLTLKRVDDVHEVYVNGSSIGSAGSFPPAFRSGADEVNRYKIPRGLLKKGRYNTIAIRIFDREGSGGFAGPAPVIAGYFLESVLGGEWEFRTGDDLAWADAAHASRPSRAVFENFVESTTTLQQTAKLYGGSRLSPKESLARFHVADDLALDQVLTEPIIAQPLFMSFDERGRLWVVQYRQYPYPAGLKMVSRDKYYRAVYDKLPEPPPNHVHGADQITIHEDTDGNGRFDKHKTFASGLNIVTSLAHGRGGVWVLNPPYLLFYPDEDRNDVPDASPEVHLKGFGLEDTHSVCNSLCWGPDGWLYLAQGSTVSSYVTCPKTDAKPIYREGPAIWRYHPESRRFEVFAEGGGNAFGIEIDAQGRLYSGHNGGETRGFHYVHGGYYAKGGLHKYGPLSNPYAFGNLPFMAHAPVPRFTHDFVKYEGGVLPARYQGKLFCVDPLNRNLVLAGVQAKGSSFATKDEGYPLASDDHAFRPVNIVDGPDGAIYVADFYEHYIAHGQHFQGQIDPSTGRIYRLRKKDAPALRPFDLNKRTTKQLVELLGHSGRWYRQTALRLIGDRKDRSIAPELRNLVKSETGQLALESLWALNLIGELREQDALGALRHDNSSVRKWAVRLLADDGRPQNEVARPLIELARSESDSEVRSQLAASARRLPGPAAMPIIRELLKHNEDIDDPHLPLMIWWAIEAKAESDADAAVQLLSDREIRQAPMFRQHIAARLMRRYAATGSQRHLLVCGRLLTAARGDSQLTELLVSGFEQALQGRTLVNMPAELAEALAASGKTSLLLDLRQKKRVAIESALQIVRERKADASKQLEVVRIFGEIHLPESIPVLLEMLEQPRSDQLKVAALGALQQYSDKNIGIRIAGMLDSLSGDVAHAAQTLLVSRADWCQQLFAALEAGKLDAKTVPGDIVRLMTVHPNNDKLVRKYWPDLAGESTTAEMQQRIERYAGTLASGTGNPYAGLKLYSQSCGKCHMLFGQGGRIGPDLTAYNRDDTVRMLLHVVNPSVEIREGFTTYLVTTDDGRAASGFLYEETPAVLVLRTATGQTITIPQTEVDEKLPLAKSIMPEGLLDEMTDQQIRDLFAYLRAGQPISK